MMFTDWLARREMLSPDKVALLDATRGGALRPVTYREWNRAANRTAQWLRAHHGVGPGDRVAVLARNCVEYLDLWFACGKLGAVLQTLNWRLTPTELGGLLAEAPARVLVYGAEFAPQVAAVRARGPAAERFVALDPGARSDPADVAFAEREACPDAPPEAPALGADAPWVICYTGGSTGLPKGAVLTHGGIVANAVNTVASWGLSANDVAILNAPLFHVGGLNVLTSPLVLCGGTSIVCAGFDPAQVFDLVRDAGVTAFFGVPTMFQAMIAHPRWAEADFSRVALVISGGAPCPAPIFEAFWARGVDFKTGYGLTEAGPNNFWLPRALVQQKPGSVGHPLFFVETRVVDAEGRACGTDEPGELWLRGPHLFAGYFQRPEETARTLVDGWLRTGDLVRRDAEGCFSIVGRIKDVIISGGENIYPAEVEGVLCAHPDVAEAALIGVADPKWGEVGRALVVARPGARPDPDGLLAFCRERLARYKVPREVVYCESLPRTGAGKIDKPALRKRHGSA